MKTVDHKVRPFTASYQAIDEDNEIYAFTLQDTPQIERQENVSTSDDEKTISAQENEKKTDF